MCDSLFTLRCRFASFLRKISRLGNLRRGMAVLRGVGGQIFVGWDLEVVGWHGG